jgi:perosamine synthetase
MFSVLVAEAGRRDRTMRDLAELGIETRPFFVPLHHLPPYASDAPRPVAEDLAARGINLPSGPLLTEADVDRVCASVIDATG